MLNLLGLDDSCAISITAVVCLVEYRRRYTGEFTLVFPENSGTFRLTVETESPHESNVWLVVRSGDKVILERRGEMSGQEFGFLTREKQNILYIATTGMCRGIERIESKCPERAMLLAGLTKGAVRVGGEASVSFSFSGWSSELRRFLA